MTDGPQITATDLEITIRPDDDESMPLNLKQARDEAELKAITHALARADNNLAHAARLLGISRPTLYSLLEKFAIDHHGE